jgi:heavy metal sensor kinase
MLYAVFFIFSVSLLFSIAYFLLSSSLKRRDHQVIEHKISEYTLMERNNGIKALLHELRIEDTHNELIGFFVRVVHPGHQTVFVTMPREWKGVNPGQVPLGLHKNGQWVRYEKPGDDDQLEITGRRLSNGYFLQVGADSEVREDLLERFLDISAVIGLPVLVLGLAGGLFVSFRALRPLKDLIQTIKNVDMGQMDARVPPSQTGDELDELTALFNGMLAKIQALIQGMRETLDNVAHDLRTPATRLRGTVELALETGIDVQTLREALMDCAEESERISTVLNTLMDLSEVEAGMMQLERKEVDLAEIISQVVELYEYVAEEKAISIEVSHQQKMFAHVDHNRIRQALANILDNAVKYTPEKGQIRVETGQTDREFLIHIQDNGIGIHGSELPRIFDRLFRGDKSRSQRGLGLGLSIVRAFIEAHNGRILVDSHPGRGTRFTVCLPKDA